MKTNPHFERSALKAIPEAGILAGQSYWWWDTPGCLRGFSQTKPKPSQMTANEFLKSFFLIREAHADAPPLCEIDDDLEELVGELDALRVATQSAYDALPGALHGGDAGDTLLARVDALAGCVNAIEGIDTSHAQCAPAEGDDGFEEDDGDDLEEMRADEIWEEVTAALGIHTEAL